MSEPQVSEGLETDTVEAPGADFIEVAEQSESNTPGAVLRRAREARGHSIADVVQVIRFSARQIEALERDDYASLPGSTAVRGLVRNYAKFIKLDPAPLLAQLEPSVPVSETDVRPPANMGKAEQSATIVERIPPGLIAAGVVVLLLALAGYWYSTLPADSWLAGLWRGVQGSSAAGLPSQTEPPALVPVLQPVPAVVAGNVPVVEAEASSSLPFAGLRVEFDDRSWIEVRDATQKVVFVGEYPAGIRQNVDGKAPFQIWIGRASAVRVFMGERSIDLKPHTREDVARLSLE